MPNQHRCASGPASQVLIRFESMARTAKRLYVVFAEPRTAGAQRHDVVHQGPRRNNPPLFTDPAQRFLGKPMRGELSPGAIVTTISSRGSRRFGSGLAVLFAVVAAVGGVGATRLQAEAIWSASHSATVDGVPRLACYEDTPKSST